MPLVTAIVNVDQKATSVGPIAYLVPLARANLALELLRGTGVTLVLVLSPF